MTTPAIDFDSLLPEGLHLKDYQQVGVAYALLTRRCFIADEMGLGKTWQALVALKASGVLNNGGTAVIVCPATLRGNWESEIRRLLPEHSVQVLLGERPYETFADILVISYNLLSVWGPFLAPEALIFDESHYCKDKGTEKKPVQRTRAALALAQRVPSTGLVLNLTGTALLNRPVELVSQLQILGRLQDVSPRPRKANPVDRDWEYAFKFSFCGPKHNGHGYEFKGSSNEPVLNERLRSSCYVRRLRKEVLGMNDTERHAIKLSLNGALDTYRAAERDLISFLRSTKGIDAATKAQRAEILVSLNTLRTLAGLAKIDAAKEWVADFFESNEGSSLVVFAAHIEVQKALLKAFPNAAHILGGEKDPEGQKARFLSGETNLIVCSLKAAREGHTLVGPAINCHDVLFIEQGWHPGEMQQAEDRINRIGQDSPYVFAHTLLADGTIDEWVYNLIEAKRAVFKAVADGTPLNADADTDIEAIQFEVLRRLAGKFEEVAA